MSCIHHFIKQLIKYDNTTVLDELILNSVQCNVIKHTKKKCKENISKYIMHISAKHNSSIVLNNYFERKLYTNDCLTHIFTLGNYKENTLRIFNMFIAAGMNPYVLSENKKYNLLLHYAMINKQPELLEKLCTQYNIPCNYLTNSDFLQKIFGEKLTENNEKLIKLMLKFGLDINYNIDNNPYTTPVILACRYGDINMVKFLLKNGEKSNCHEHDNRYGYAFKFAVLKDDVKLAKLLLKYGADIKLVPECLNIAINNQNKIIIDLLLEYNIPVDNGHTTLFSCETPLMISIIKDNFEVFQKIIARTNCVNERSYFSCETALHYACKNNKYDMIKCILEKDNSGVNFLDRSGECGLSRLIKNFDNKPEYILNTIELLFSHGANPFVVNDCIFTLFNQCLSCRTFDKILILLFKYWSENTVRYIYAEHILRNSSCRKYSANTLEIILKKLDEFCELKCEIKSCKLEKSEMQENSQEQKDADTQCLCLGCISDHSNIQKEINKTDMGGDTALYISVKDNNYEITELLLRYGADPTKQLPYSYDEKNLFEIASFHNNEKMINLLAKYAPLFYEQTPRFVSVLIGAAYHFDTNSIFHKDHVQDERIITNKILAYYAAEYLKHQNMKSAY